MASHSRALRALKRLVKRGWRIRLERMAGQDTVWMFESTRNPGELFRESDPELDEVIVRGCAKTEAFSEGDK
jgi:hypothetical protein